MSKEVQKEKSMILQKEMIGGLFDPGRNGRVPRIQTFRSPFFSRIVVTVAVVTPIRISRASGSSGTVSLLMQLPRPTMSGALAQCQPNAVSRIPATSV